MLLVTKNTIRSVSEDGSLREKFGGEENVTAGRYASAGR